MTSSFHLEFSLGSQQKKPLSIGLDSSVILPRLTLKSPLWDLGEVKLRSEVKGRFFPSKQSLSAKVEFKGQSLQGFETKLPVAGRFVLNTDLPFWGFKAILSANQNDSLPKEPGLILDLAKNRGSFLISNTQQKPILKAYFSKLSLPKKDDKKSTVADDTEREKDAPSIGAYQILTFKLMTSTTAILPWEAFVLMLTKLKPS